MEKLKSGVKNETLITLSQSTGMFGKDTNNFFFFFKVMGKSKKIYKQGNGVDAKY